MAAYYNDIDPFCVAWLRELIKEGHIAPGDVDDRSIKDVKASDLVGYRQCHFFAGIGGWSLALRLAGVGDDEPVDTGSCPCQPFSDAGKKRGRKDPRHLWPWWKAIIAERDPAVCFGEQVASAAGRRWFSGVRADLERMGRAVGAADLCVACKGAPHIRQRLWGVADAGDAERAGRRVEGRGSGFLLHSAERGGAGGVAFADGDGQSSRKLQPRSGRPDEAAIVEQGLGGPVEHSESARRNGRAHPAEDIAAQAGERGRVLRVGGPSSLSGLVNSAGDGLRSGGRAGADKLKQSSDWSLFELVPCADGKARRVEPGTFPLAHAWPDRRLGSLLAELAGMGVDPGAARDAVRNARGVLARAGRNRVGRLRGYGNAICPEVAAEFIRAYREAREMTRAAAARVNG